MRAWIDAHFTVYGAESFAFDSLPFAVQGPIGAIETKRLSDVAISGRQLFGTAVGIGIMVSESGRITPVEVAKSASTAAPD